MMNNSEIKNQKSPMLRSESDSHRRTKLRKGFTLIEVVVATAVFAFFLGSVIAAMMATAHNGPINERRLQAANLAREGAQLVTQIRDTNWIQNEAWDNGVSAGSKQLAESGGYWTLNDGDQTIDVIFTREITISNIGTDKKLVTVTVSWLEGGVPATPIVIKKLITNWKAI